VCLCAAYGAMGEFDAAMQNPASGWPPTCLCMLLHGLCTGAYMYGLATEDRASERRDSADKKAWHGTKRVPGNTP
jgi:hypothetical protein